MRNRTPERVQDRGDMSFVLKACPRCLGDLVRQHDVYGDYYACLLCGIEIEPGPKIAVGQAQRPPIR